MSVDKEQDLLIEIGVEELPASFVASALEQAPTLISKLLTDARVVHRSVKALGTPRRITVQVEGVATRQLDRSEELVGPPVSIAFGSDGALTKAGEAFSKRVTGPTFRKTTEKGECIAGRQEEKGASSSDVLPGIVQGYCAGLSFGKSMRWGAGTAAFGRPVQWLVALFGNDVVPATFAGVHAGKRSRGHRFYASDAFDVNVTTYATDLATRHVIADMEERVAIIRERLGSLATELGAVVIEDEALIRDCANLVEEPHVLSGRFDEAFLALPEEVVVSVMRGHQKYFALRDVATGKLKAAYLNVVNTAAAPDLITRGNDRVLRARLKDATFFVSEDAKAPLAERVPRLDAITFQAKLGSVGDKGRRLKTLALYLSEIEGVDGSSATRAAELAKADLITHVVGEFPELQGVVGRNYAARDGEAANVADALLEHYLPRGAADELPKSDLGAILAIADRVDTLVGCFGIGMIPTGSQDPFALRRAALGVIRILRDGRLKRVRLRELLRAAHSAYPATLLQDAAVVLEKLDAFFVARLEVIFSEKLPKDIVDAAIGAWDRGTLWDLEARVVALDAFRKDPAFPALATAFKRTFNITEGIPRREADASRYTEQAEKRLAEAFQKIRSEVDSACERREYTGALNAIARDLREPIDDFFTNVFVMAEDPSVRENRLALLSSINDTIRRVAHFERVQLSTGSSQ